MWKEVGRQRVKGETGTECGGREGNEAWTERDGEMTEGEEWQVERGTGVGRQEREKEKRSHKTDVGGQFF